MPEHNPIAVLLSTIFNEILCKNEMMATGCQADPCRHLTSFNLTLADKAISAQLAAAVAIGDGLVLKIAIERRMIAPTHNHPEW